jgi:hypothetical protein
MPHARSSLRNMPSTSVAVSWSYISTNWRSATCERFLKRSASSSFVVHPKSCPPVRRVDLRQRVQRRSMSSTWSGV